MGDKSSLSEKIDSWINILILILVALNVGIFLIYHLSHPSENVWIQLWKYFDSNIFKIVTVSLIFPIILFLLESRLKVIETIWENRRERERKVEQERREKAHRDEQERREKARQEEETRRERRLECITLTIQMWNKLYDLINDVIHLKIDANNKDGIEDLQKKLSDFISSANDVFIKWYPRFNLPKEKEVNKLYLKAEKLFLYCIRTLFNSTETVAYFIGKSNNKDERKDLQNSLRIIQQGIEAIAYNIIISTLENFMKLGELYEDQASNDKEKEDIQTKIKNDLNSLVYCIRPIKRLKMNYNKILPSVEDTEIEAFREVAKKVGEWKREHLGKPLSKCEEYRKFRRLFYKISHEELVEGTLILYSKEFIKHFADYLYFKFICRVLEREAR